MKYIYIASSTDLLIRKSIVSLIVININNEKYTIDNCIDVINTKLNAKMNSALTLNQHPFYMIDSLYLWKVTDDITMNCINDNILQNISSACDICSYVNKSYMTIHNLVFKKTPFYKILLDISETVEAKLPVKNVCNIGDALIYKHKDDIKINKNYNHHELSNLKRTHSVMISSNDKNKQINNDDNVDNFDNVDNNIQNFYIKERIEVLKQSSIPFKNNTVDGNIQVQDYYSKEQNYIKIAKNEWKVMSETQRESIKKRFKM